MQGSGPGNSTCAIWARQHAAFEPSAPCATLNCQPIQQLSAQNARQRLVLRQIAAARLSGSPALLPKPQVGAASELSERRCEAASKDGLMSRERPRKRCRFCPNLPAAALHVAIFGPAGPALQQHPKAAAVAAGPAYFTLDLRRAAPWPNRSQCSLTRTWNWHCGCTGS